MVCYVVDRKESHVNKFQIGPVTYFSIYLLPLRFKQKMGSPSGVPPTVTPASCCCPSYTTTITITTTTTTTTTTTAIGSGLLLLLLFLLLFLLFGMVADSV